MRKFCTFLLTAVLAMLASVSYAADVNIAVAEEFTSVASLEGKTFAIIDQANEKALYGTNNQNLGYNVYTSAFQDSNSGYMWKLVSLANDADTEVQGFYRLQLVTPSGADYNCWGMGGWLNSQPATGAVSFILGLNNQNGQDMKNGAVYDVQYVEGKGFTLKNIGTGLYQNDAAPAKYEEPTYWTFGTVASDYTPVVKELLAEGEALKATAVSDDAKAAYESAIANIDADDVENSQANMKIVDAAINELAKAQPTVDGADFTRAIANPSFETNSLEGWTSTDGGAPATNGNFGKATGGVFVEKWTESANQLSNGSCLQEIAGLPNGEYTVTAEMQCLEQGNGNANGTGFFLVANEDKTECTEAGQTVSVTTKVTDGVLTIGAKIEDCSGNWVCFDNFRLTLVKADSDEPSVVKEEWAEKAPAVAKDYANNNGGAFIPANYVVDEDGNGYYEVVSNENPANPWDCQIFVSVLEKLNKFDKLKISMKVKADNELEASSGMHTSNDGNGWVGHVAIGNVKFTNEWTLVEREFEITNEAVNTFVLDLSDANTNAANKYYFDEITFTVTPAETVTYVDVIPVAEGTAEQAPEQIYILAKERPVDGNNTHRARYTEQAAKDGQFGIEVVTDAKTDAAWDNQFWIRQPYALPEGAKYIIEFDYKAEKAAKATTQAHANPGEYIHCIGIGDVNFTTEWQHFKYEGAISAAQTGNPAKFLSIAFNLNEFADANTYCFDNITWKVAEDAIEGLEQNFLNIELYPEVEYVDPSTLEWTENILPNGDIEGSDFGNYIIKISTDTERDPEMAVATKGKAAGNASESCLQFKAYEQPKDPEDEIKYVGNEWDSQFFIRLPYMLPAGTKIDVAFDYFGSRSASVSTQSHMEPGEYINGNMLGDIAFEPLYVKDENGEDTKEKVWKQFQKYVTVGADMRTIVFNLCKYQAGANYYFDNISVKILKSAQEEILASDAVKAQDENSLWPATLALNETITEAKAFDTSNKSDEFIANLTEAIQSGKDALNATEGKTAETLAAAKQAIEDAMNAVEPEPLDPDLIEIAQDQGQQYDTFTRAELVEGDAYNTYTSNADLTVAFKMKDIDVKGCDYVVVKFAEPVPAGWKIAFWGNQDNVDIPEGATEFKFVFEEDTKNAVENDVLKEITVLNLWGATYPLVMKVSGVYKHSTGLQTYVDGPLSRTSAPTGLYMEDGKIVIVKREKKKYAVSGALIE